MDFSQWKVYNLIKVETLHGNVLFSRFFFFFFKKIKSTIQIFSLRSPFFLKGKVFFCINTCTGSGYSWHLKENECISKGYQISFRTNFLPEKAAEFK